MTQGKYQNGQTVFVISSARFIKEAVVLKYAGGFYTIRWKDSPGGMRVRESRLFSSREEAQAQLKK